MADFAISLFSNLVSDPYNGFVNVFGYRGPDVAYTSSIFDDFVDSFKVSILAPLQNVTSNSVTFTKMSMRSLDGAGYEFENVFPSAINGAVENEYLPMFNAWAFQYVRASVGQRSGAKRFAGIARSNVANGAPVAIVLDRLHTLATALMTPVETDEGLYYPKIIHKTGSLTADLHDIAGVQYKRISTQNSRKR